MIRAVMNKIKFAFIEAMILEHKVIRRAHLCRAFDVAPPTATRYLSEYKKLHPDFLEYDISIRSYKAGKLFFSIYLETGASKFLEAAQVMSEHVIINKQTIIT